ncbi:MAG: acyl-[acyl-carrier-protein] thioesterase [Thermoplasmatota archaeon]
MLEKKSVFTVSTYQCDSKGRIQPHSLMHQVQEAATKHAEELGVGYEWMERNRFYWVLVNFGLQFFETPIYGTSIMLRTWPSGLDPLKAYRDFSGEDLKGRKLFIATSDWMVIDASKMRPVMIADLGFDFEHSSTRIMEGPERLSHAGNFNEVGRIVVPYSSIDMNGHVNNTEYIRWGMDSARREIGDLPNIRSFKITFMSEVFKNEELALMNLGVEEGRLRVKGTRTRDGKDAFVMEIEYEV